MFQNLNKAQRVELGLVKRNNIFRFNFKKVIGLEYELVDSECKGKKGFVVN